MFGIPSLWSVGIGAVIFGLALYFAFDTGRDIATTQYELRIATMRIEIQTEHEKELLRMVEANRLAKEHQKTLVKELAKTQGDLEKIMEQNELEAKDDPEANTYGIGPGAVERLNRIK